MAGNDCRDRWNDTVGDCDTTLTKLYNRNEDHEWRFHDDSRLVNMTENNPY
jgi:hypothetical protein